ncbi:MAG TPA: primase-helicase zinc-binding domain-containing protein [Methanoculleus sp.]|uniref:IS1096 element passenger TnpR family protein n=1 Tax=Methanoculleus sp. TaxID=90427 RepID=UPI002CC3802B|nr:primase-helicase zinc-binding domain-containing protein [Methanoculleus sp.]
MAPRNVPGTCMLCREPVSRRGALRHVEGCLRSSGWPAGEKPSLIITIQGRHDRSYWLVVLARPDATLEDLDSLIRDVWVECCGHMSAFSIGKESYLSGEDEPGTSMAIPLSGLVPPGSTFSYEYDFGSTTELDLKVIGAIPILPPEKPICLIARNNPPPFPCDACGNQAEFSLFDDEDGTLRFFCRECLVSAEPDPECTEIIENSPRTGICGYVEDPDAAVYWYPPGWNAEDLASPELEEILKKLPEFDPDDCIYTFEDPPGDAEVQAMMDAVCADIGPEIEAFIADERAAHGEFYGALAGETVMEFCVFTYGLRGKTIREWDARLVRTCLIEEMAQNPIFPEEWLENAVPILCRFLSSMEAAGRLQNAAELIAVLKEAEPAFRAAATSPEKYRDLSGRIFQRALDAGVDPEDERALMNFVQREVVVMAGMDPDDADLIEKIEYLFKDDGIAPNSGDLRVSAILFRCEEFCARLEDGTIPGRCGAIVGDLAAHPAAPLSRGDEDLWSAAVVYAACRDVGLIRPGKGGTPLAREIGSFFDLEPSSVRNKVAALKKYLPGTPGAED